MKNDRRNDSPEETQSSGPQNDSCSIRETRWQLAQLAATLLKPSDVSAASSQLRWADDYFHDRAKVTVQQARILFKLTDPPPTQETSLYQWFTPGEKMGPKEISSRIAQLNGWRNSQSVVTVTTRLKEIEGFWAARILFFEKDSPHQLSSANEARNRIAQFLQEIKEAPELEAIRSKLEKESQRFLDSLITPEIFATDEERGQALGERERRLFEWCFGREPRSGAAKEVIKTGPKKSAGNSSSQPPIEKVSYKDVRAHELYRFAEDKKFIPQQLRPQPISSLPASLQPEWIFRQCSPRRSFELFNIKCEDQLFFCYPWGS